MFYFIDARKRKEEIFRDVDECDSFELILNIYTGSAGHRQIFDPSAYILKVLFFPLTDLWSAPSSTCVFINPNLIAFQFCSSPHSSSKGCELCAVVQLLLLKEEGKMQEKWSSETKKDTIHPCVEGGRGLSKLKSWDVIKLISFLFLWAGSWLHRDSRWPLQGHVPWCINPGPSLTHTSHLLKVTVWPCWPSQRLWETLPHYLSFKKSASRAFWVIVTWICTGTVPNHASLFSQDTLLCTPFTLHSLQG